MKITIFSIKDTKIIVAIILFCISNYQSIYAIDGEDTAYPKPMDYINKVSPPSPEAFRFSVYGNIPVNNANGSFSYSLPIYTIASNDITVPISLDYNSNGVKVDQLTSNVGIDWNLAAGGVITRIMKSAPDDLTERWYMKGGMNDSLLLEAANRGRTGFPGPHIKEIDTEHDIFNFNINGLVGKFYFDEDLKIYVSCNEAVEIENLSETGAFTIFRITDTKGYQYIFGGNQDYIETTRVIEINETLSASFKGTPSRSVTSLIDNPPHNSYNSVWYLKEIISPNNNKVNFEYEPNVFEYPVSSSYNISYPEIGTFKNLQMLRVWSESLSFGYMYNKVKSKALSDIYFNNGKVHFTYDSNRLDGGGLLLKKISIYKKSSNNEYQQPFYSYNIEHDIYTYSLTTTLHNENLFKLMKEEGYSIDKLSCRYFMKSVEKKDSINTSIEKYQFEYNEPGRLPHRLSYDQDYFGFSTGNNRNNNPFSKNLLNNKKLNDLLEKTPQSETVSGFGITKGLYIADREVSPNNVYDGMLNRIYYPTGGYTQIDYEANSTSVKDIFSVYTKKNIMVTNNLEASKALPPLYGIDFDFISTHDTIAIKISTANCKDIPNSGNTGTNHLFVTITDLSNNENIYNGGEHITRDGVNGSYKYLKVNKNHEYRVRAWIESEYKAAHGEVYIEYNPTNTEITKAVYAAGARVKEITDYSDNQEYNKRKFFYNTLENLSDKKTTLIEMTNPIYFNQAYYVFSGIEPNIGTYKVDILRIYTVSASPLNNMYFGSQKQEAYYTVVTEILETNGISNGAITRHYFKIEDESGRLQCGPTNENQRPYSNTAEAYYGLKKEEGFFKFLNETKKYTLHQKKYYSYASLKEEYLVSSFISDMDSRTRADADITYYPKKADNITVYRYKNYMKLIKPSEVVTTEYMVSGDSIQTKTIYTYDGEPYYNLKQKTATTSTIGTLFMNTYKYSYDYQSPVHTEMVNRNMVSPIIERTVLNNGKNTQVKFEYFNSDNKILLRQIQNSITGPNNYKTEIYYDKYDNKGNILYYKDKDAFPVVYLWSYCGQYPIVEIKDASYEEVKAALGWDDNYINSLSGKVVPSDSDMAKINGLRTSLPKAMVTTYVYKPLVGLRSATDPRGIKTTYEYDDFGRLKQIKDNKDKLIESYDYNYRNK